MEKPIHDIRPARPARKRTDLKVPTYIGDARPVTKTETPDAPRWLVLTLQILAYGIPLTFLAYVLYINYLPFGYDKTFTIDVGAEGDTTVGEFYLEPSPDLSERKTDADGTTYRELKGLAYAVFKPPVVLKDAEITVSVEGEGVSIIPPVIDFNPDDYEWDYEWDFTNPETAFTPKTSERTRAEWTACTTTALSTGASTTTEVDEVIELTSETATSTEICEQIPVPDLVGNAFFFDGGMYFDGNSRLEMPGTADMFEDGPLTLYMEWTPTNSVKNGQQIIGHFNWEVWQNRKSLELRIGKLTDPKETVLIITHPIDDTFFNMKHSLVAIYSPNDGSYFELYVDGYLINRQPLNQALIDSEYNKNENLSFGWTPHNFRQLLNFEGTISKVFVKNSVISNQHLEGTSMYFNDKNQFYIIGDSSKSKVSSFTLHVEKI